MIKHKYELLPSKTFHREFRKLSNEHKKSVAQKMLILQNNHKHPSLRTKKLISANKEIFFESSVNMDIRLVWRYKNNEIILMLDVGHHDILKRY